MGCFLHPRSSQYETVLITQDSSSHEGETSISFGTRKMNSPLVDARTLMLSVPQ